jgi:hypothetical protein
MPNWLVILGVLIAVVPGLAVIVIGVVALFLSPPPHDPLLQDAGPGEADTPSSSPNEPPAPSK